MSLPWREARRPVQKGNTSRSCGERPTLDVRGSLRCVPSFDSLGMEAHVCGGFTGVHRQLVTEFSRTPAFKESLEFTSARRLVRVGRFNRWLVNCGVRRNIIRTRKRITGCARHGVVGTPSGVGPAMKAHRFQHFVAEPLLRSASTDR